jgi:hypothetical protein
MKKNKKLFYLSFPLVLIFSILASYFLYITVQTPCKDGLWPIPPPASLRFSPYYLITDQGPLYISQTYEHRNEGPWVGNMTLLFLDSKGATLLFRYPQGKGPDFKVMACKGFIPRTSENEAGK